MPRAGEHYCYAKGSLVFSDVTLVVWLRRNSSHYTDASGEVDFGNIDILTMDGDAFVAEGDGPAVSVLAATPSTVANLLMTWVPAHPDWDILRVGGEREKSVDKSRFMNEVAAALQFPYYFGHNWSAFRDCVNDLSWLKGASFLIVFDSVQDLLSESDKDFEILLRILSETHDEWRAVTTDFGARGRLPITFQSVLACEPEAVDALTQRMSDADATFTRL